MKRFQASWRFLGLFTLLAVGLGLAGCKSGGQSLAEKWGDRQVAGNVKKELKQDPMYHYTDVVPIVNDGTVLLTGFVDTPEERQRAAELAAHAQGAQQIINTIELKSRATGRAGGRLQSTNAPAPATEEPKPAAPEGQAPNPESKPNP